MDEVTKTHKPCVPISQSFRTQSFRTIARTGGLIWGFIVLLVLAGCEGDTGDRGPSGPPGTSAPPDPLIRFPKNSRFV